jgi:hypothetical protein
MNFDYLFKSYNISKQNKFECNHVNKLTLNIKVKEKKLYYIYMYGIVQNINSLMNKKKVLLRKRHIN